MKPMKKPIYRSVYYCYGGAILSLILDLCMLSFTDTWNGISGFLKYLDAFLFYCTIFLLIGGTVLWNRIHKKERSLARWKNYSIKTKGTIKEIEKNPLKETSYSLSGTFYSEKNAPFPFSMEMSNAKIEALPEIVEIYYNEADPMFYLAECTDSRNYTYINEDPNELLKQCGISTKWRDRPIK